MLIPFFVPKCYYRLSKFAPFVFGQTMWPCMSCPTAAYESLNAGSIQI